MIKQAIFAVIAAATFAAISSPAYASDWYVKAEVGTTFDTQVETSFGGTELTDELTYGAYVGTAVGPVRVEVGASHIAGDVNLGGIALETSAIDYNATVYLDLATSENGGFYVGGGADYIQAEYNFGPFFGGEESGFGYHVTGGYAHRAGPGIMEFQGRYLNADLDNVDLTGIAFTVGYRVGIGA